MNSNGKTAVRKKRVVITGLGVVSPCGVGKDEFWQNLLEGRSFISHITGFDTTDYPTKIGSEMRNFAAHEYLNENDARRFDETAQYAFAAASLALRDSNINLESLPKEKIGVIIGSGHGAIKSMERDILALYERGLHGPSPFAMANASSNIAAGFIALKLGLKGPNFSIVSACASGTHSIGTAYNEIALGRADMILAGATDACITPFIFAGYSFIAAMSRCNDEPLKACRPFDARRGGFVMAEGAGVVVLEELDCALERGAHIYAEIVGYGATNDAVHVTNMSRRGVGVRKAMQLAIEDAGIRLEEIDYINTHGSSTLLADQCEAAAIKDLFKHHTKKVLINSTKSITGHLMGASGAVEAIACSLSIRDGIVHATLNYENPDPECELETLANHNVKKDILYALSNSIGFGGADSSLVFKKYCDQ